jgi:hypothetical protein
MTLLTFFLPEEVPLSDPPNWMREDCDIVTPDYFATMGIELLRGRGFTESDDDDAPGVVVVNETMARTHFPGVDPIASGSASGTGDSSVTISTRSWGWYAT